MNTKKIATILISIAFLLIVAISGVGFLSVKKISVNYAVADTTEAEQIQSVLDEFLNKNLLFLDAEEVRNALKDYHYFEVLSVEKQFPNVVNVSIKERREVYYVNYQGEYFVTTAEGFVLNSFSAGVAIGDVSVARDKIILDLNGALGGLQVKSIVPGSFIETEDDFAMRTIFEMAKSVNLTDCIKKITVDKIHAGASSDYLYDYNVRFSAYSGVDICIEEVLIKGCEKAEKAFLAYDKILTDYQKTFGEIQSILTYDGEYRVSYEQVLIMTDRP